MTSSSSSRQAAASSLRERLRTDTREAHEALDAVFEGMFSDTSGARYRRFIAMNLAAHVAIEPVLADSPLPALEEEPERGNRLAAAQRDAQTLALPLLPAPEFPLARPDLFQAFGIAYVLEGSRLGAKYMSRAIKRDQRDGDVGLPTHYLEASSDARPFTRLLDRMEAEPAGEDDMRRASEAADATFRYFHALSGNDQERTTRA